MGHSTLLPLDALDARDATRASPSMVALGGKRRSKCERILQTARVRQPLAVSDQDTEDTIGDGRGDLQSYVRHSGNLRQHLRDPFRDDDRGGDELARCVMDRLRTTEPISDRLTTNISPATGRSLPAAHWRPAAQPIRTEPRD